MVTNYSQRNMQLDSINADQSDNLIVISKITSQKDSLSLRQENTMSIRMLYLILMAVILAAAIPDYATAHCDHLDGPVVNDARIALNTENISPVLKWINEADEGELNRVFNQVLTVRAAGGEAQEVADRLFFETLVRLHRISEGASYTGLKPAGTPVAAYVTLSDNALDQGSPDVLIGHLGDAMDRKISEMFQKAHSLKKQSETDPTKGREFVHTYVELVHYVKNIVQAINNASPAHHDH
jgi:hypothetical protein